MGKPMADKIAYSRITTIAIIFIAILLVPAFSSAGISITPASGEYSIRKSGGRMDFLVTNYADYTETFTFTLSGDGAAYSSVTPTFETIGPGETKKFTVIISPSNSEYNRRYSLVASAESESSRASGTVSIVFKDEVGESKYTLSEIPPNSLKGETSLTNRLFTFFAATLLVGIGIYLIKSRGPWKD